MSLVSIEVKNFPDFKNMGILIENFAAASVVKVSAVFTEWLQKSKFHDVFEDRTGETRKSIGFYRTKKKNPEYLIRPGVGIPGMLNYLYGEARGYATSRSGKKFSYTKKRDVVNEGWKEWQGNMNAIFEQMKDKFFKRIEETL
jgi:hypothetical protein